VLVCHKEPEHHNSRFEVSRTRLLLARLLSIHTQYVFLMVPIQISDSVAYRHSTTTMSFLWLTRFVLVGPVLRRLIWIYGISEFQRCLYRIHRVRGKQYTRSWTLFLFSCPTKRDCCFFVVCYTPTPLKKSTHKKNSHSSSNSSSPSSKLLWNSAKSLEFSVMISMTY